MATSIITVPFSIFDMSSFLITTGGFLPGIKTAPITKSADLIAFVDSFVSPFNVFIESP